MLRQTLWKMNIVGAVLSSTSIWACNASHVLGVGGSGAVYTMSANTMTEGGLYVGLNAERVSNNTLTDATILQAIQNGSEHLHNIDTINSYSLSLSYGITDSLTLNMQLPYISRTNIRAGELDNGIPQVHPHNDTQGIGDLSAILQYKIYDEDKTKIALLAGIKTPTGKTNIQEEGEVLEADLLPGSGSWDFFAGAAFTKDFETLSLHSSVLYKYNNKGVDSSQLGDVFNYNIALSYKLKEMHAHTSNEIITHEDFGYSVNVFLELNGEWTDADRFSNVEAPNTGHNVIFATTGIQVLTEESYALFFTISVPLYQNFNGLQNDISYKSSIGIGRSF